MPKKTAVRSRPKPRFRNRTLTIVIAFVIVLIAVAIATTGRNRGTDSKSTPTTAGVHIVPFPEEINFYTYGGPAQPWVDESQMLQALSIILKLQHSPDLQTPVDRAIMRLAKEYLNGEREFRVHQSRVEGIGSHADRPTYGRLAHTCSKDQYAYDQIQSNPPVLAVSLYHELFHGADCAGYLERQHDPNDPFDHEPGAYAAQVRLFVALYHAKKFGKMPISAEEPSDTGVLQQTYEVWQALLTNSFTKWYEEKLNEGSGGKMDINKSVFTEVPSQ